MDDIKEMQRQVQELREDIAELDIPLRDYYRRRDALLNELAKTFPHRKEENEEDGSFRPPSIVVTQFTFENAALRKDIIVEKDRLNAEFWPAKNKRRNLRIEAESLEKIIKWTIENEHKRAKRERKKPQKSFAF